MKRKKMTQIIATLALFAIVIGIIGTGILILTTGNQPQPIELTQEQLQELINAQSGATTSTGDAIDLGEIDDIMLQNQ